eukprot:scpid99291/ scgid28864/ 
MPMMPFKMPLLQRRTSGPWAKNMALLCLHCFVIGVSLLLLLDLIIDIHLFYAGRVPATMEECLKETRWLQVLLLILQLLNLTMAYTLVPIEKFCGLECMSIEVETSVNCPPKPSYAKAAESAVMCV